MSIVKINEAKDQFEELISRAEAGETILIEKDGKTIVKLEAMPLPAAEPKRKIDISELQEFTRSLPPATESAADLIRRLRDESY
jgi:antitoxin (DNA-binding transcriptional repressor) of toxin-antitoxin stability system